MYLNKVHGEPFLKILELDYEQGPSHIADFFTLYKPNRSLRSESNTFSPCAWSKYSNKQTVIELRDVDHLEFSPQRVKDNKIVYFI